MAEDCTEDEERSFLDIIVDIFLIIVDFFLKFILGILIIDFLLGLIAGILAFIFGAILAQILAGLLFLLAILWMFYMLGKIFVWRFSDLLKKLHPEPA